MTAYLDHAATTPARASALAAFAEVAAMPGNPSSLHAAGRAVRRVVEESRESLAADLGAHPTEVVLTSGGTEADNLAVAGAFRARRAADPRRRRILLSPIEHHAVLDTVEHLVRAAGATVTWLDVDRQGLVSVAGLREAIATDPGSVALVSVMWANNEIGTVEPIGELAAVAHEHGIPLHTDAVQAFGHVPLDVHDVGADLVSVTAHKLGGPVGFGALVVRRDIALEPLTHGGGQERGLRSGTLAAAGARAFAVAAHEAVGSRESESARIVGLRDRLLRGAVALDEGIAVTGAWQAGDGLRRLPGNAHVIVEGADGESLLLLLDAAGIACSTGSACAAGVSRPSHVLTAIGYADAEARGALRLTLGHTSTDADVDAVLAVLPDVVTRSRAAVGVGA
ncbi:cysteine desulfurase involved in tRNA thiolation [Nostocoides japonicum T1-X7]|uniref:Cysteine desulfurase involved in tRNA thiolation n=1 Tax=Nostocoides japonicum T1-X7 TaxID=1194083 RepID=A0A077LY48_9MICO|nr:cysteine desulfurase family protein [Tetrasphaera japonica]CCH78833.1 cysteine desulfurase involved in tRNA thiolation [Tetrasphaera japonica T1-X7]